MKLKAKISYFIEVDIATPNYFKTVCVPCTLFHSSYCNCFSLSVYTGFECLPHCSPYVVHTVLTEVII